MERLFRKLIKAFPKPIQDLYQRFEFFIIYVIYGAFATVVSFGTQYAASTAGCKVAVSTVISWLCAVTFAFFTNKICVFKDKRAGVKVYLKQAATFYSARLLSLLFEVIFLVVTVDNLHMQEMIMKLIAQVVIVIMNYIISKLFIFKNSENSIQ
jgi:putative flippase GtrA